MKFKLVMAGSYPQFKIYCRENNWKDAVYVSDRSVLLRYSPEEAELYTAGTPETNPQYDMLFWDTAIEFEARKKAAELYQKHFGQNKANRT